MAGASRSLRPGEFRRAVGDELRLIRDLAGGVTVVIGAVEVVVGVDAAGRTGAVPLVVAGGPVHDRPSPWHMRSSCHVPRSTG